MLTTIIAALTLLSIVLVIYHHALYPLLLRLLRRQRVKAPAQYRARSYQVSRDDDTLPRIAIVVPAYNEAAYIEAKIMNLAALDYPASKLSAVIACDGCNDQTAAIARQTAALPECRELGLQVLEFRHNRGKVAVLNDVIQHLDCDIVALSDVSALVSVDAMLVAAAQFQDPKVGVVNSQYRLLTPGSVGEADYWRYQSEIKSGEASLGATLGAHGAFYLFRRALFTQLAADTINDDFILPMQIVARGYRAEHDTRITALELEQASEAMDHQRRLRISAGNLQQLLRLKHLLLPRYRGIAFAFASGKALRVLMPFLMLTAYAGSLWLSTSSALFLIAALGQTLVYAIASYELLLTPRHSPHLVRAIGYLVSGHLAGLIGSLNYLCAGYRTPWKRVGGHVNHTALEGK